MWSIRLEADRGGRVVDFVRCSTNVRSSSSGEHRLLACSIRQLAECMRLQLPGISKPVRGKLPRTTGWQPVLPRKRARLRSG